MAKTLSKLNNLIKTLDNEQEIKKNQTPKERQLENLTRILEMIKKESITTSDFKRLVDKLFSKLKNLSLDLRSETKSIHNSTVSQTKKIVDNLSKETSAKVKKMSNVCTRLEKAEKDRFSLIKQAFREIDQIRKKMPEEADFETLRADFEAEIEEIENKLTDFATKASVKESLDDLRYWVESEHQSISDSIKKIAQRPTGRTGMKKITSVRSIDLSSQLDGSKKTFSLPKDTLKVLGVWGTSFPITYNDNDDFALVGNVLTITDEVNASTSLANGQTLKALIETAFYA